MKTNKKTVDIYTHGGGKASHINPELQLRRSVMSCLLWEKTFYEDGEEITDRIANLIPKVKPDIVNQMVLDARNKMYLRHMPLFMITVMAKLPGYKNFVKDLLFKVIQRADELTEFLAIYWKAGKCPISGQVKKGLALAFTKFNEYQLAKYNRDNAIKLKDVLFLCHAKPKNIEQEELWKRLISDQLQTPDTWEVALSAKTNETKKEKWERLLIENKLGGLALLRNFRNMIDENVNKQLIAQAIQGNDFNKVLPFRFIAAAKYAPKYEPELEAAMIKKLSLQDKLLRKTVLILDVSGSMNNQLSEKSEMTRLEVAFSLAIIARELCENISIYATAGSDYTRIHATKLLPARHGMALKDAFINAYCELGGGGIFLKQVMDYTFEKEQTAERVIVLTDEQDCDQKCNPSTAKAYGKNNYLINIASNKNGIGYGKWTHIDGWSESVIEYILNFENINTN